MRRVSVATGRAAEGEAIRQSACSITGENWWIGLACEGRCLSSCQELASDTNPRSIMTAEIAILNRSAVALAADSAVTLMLRGQQKIYNGADKLFQLSTVEPVGIMIFGGAEFMGIPLDTVIKEYRKSIGSQSRPYISEYADDFFKFLETEVQTPDQISKEHSANIIESEIFELHQTALSEAFASSPKRSTRKSFEDALIERTRAALSDRLKSLRDLPDCERFSGLDDAVFIELADGHTDTIINELLPWIKDSDDKDKIKELAFLILKKDNYSASSTGFVFAGFGTKEIFPTMKSFEADGMICGRVKRRQTSFIDIDRMGVGAHIEPFAQKEMVERFLDGIDPDFHEYIFSSMDEILAQFSDAIVDFSMKSTKAKKTAFKKSLRPVIDEYLKAFTEMSNKRRIDNFRQKVLDMVHYMPKSELATMAESLVSLTSIKRRVSAETETVGGPVDVAVISKGEGFVWIKRKHYFDRQLNPRYIINQQLSLDRKGM